MISCVGSASSSHYRQAQRTHQFKSIQFTKLHTSKWNYLLSILGKCISVFVRHEAQINGHMIGLSLRMTPVHLLGSSSSVSSFNRWKDQLTVNFKLLVRSYCTSERGDENTNMQSERTHVGQLFSKRIPQLNLHPSSHPWANTTPNEPSVSVDREKTVCFAPRSTVEMLLRSDNH